MTLIQHTIATLMTMIVLSSCNKSTEVNDHPMNDSSDYYQEEHRNQFHFAPEANWMNDPNGMVYLDGEYHLFYQYYPDSTVWGPMHWAHAVSKDMVSWEHLPIALYPDELGYIFSGSAVIDKNNTAGFGKDAMVAIYTYHNMELQNSGTSDKYEYQGIAYSTDKGRTFTKYDDNPVVPNPGIKDFRDPKVIWDEAHDQWLMVFAAYDHVKLYRSPNLKDWTHLSDWGREYGVHDGVWECPDFFPLTIEETGEQKWVLLQSLNPGHPNGGSGTQYFIGDFDGVNFKLDPDFEKEVTDGRAVWLDYGKDNYAGVTWSDIPAADGRKLFLGWMSNWQYATVVPTEKWRSAMTVARTLTLHSEDGKFRLRSNPVEELKKLDGDKTVVAPMQINKSAVIAIGDNLYKVELKFEKIEEGSVSLKLSNAKGEYVLIGYNADQKNYYIDRTQSGKVDFNDKFGVIQKAPVDYNSTDHKMVFYLDKASVELFADEGRTAMTSIHFPSAPYTKLEIVAEGCVPNLTEGHVTVLNRIWTQ